MQVVFLFFLFVIVYMDDADIVRWYEKYGTLMIVFGASYFYAVGAGIFHSMWSKDYRPWLRHIYRCYIWPLSFMVPVYFFNDISVNFYGFFIYYFLAVLISLFKEQNVYDLFHNGKESETKIANKIKSDMDFILYSILTFGLPILFILLGR